MALAADAKAAIKSWPGTQSLLSMWFHDELVPAVETYGLAGLFTRVDGLRTEVGGAPQGRPSGRAPGRARASPASRRC